MLRLRLPQLAIFNHSSAAISLALLMSLKIRAELDRGIYPAGQMISNTELSELNLELAKFHRDWNQSLLPPSKHY